MKNLRRHKIEALSLPEQAALYFENHQVNLPDNGKRPSGPSLIAQQRFWNDWKNELADWKACMME